MIQQVTDSLHLKAKNQNEDELKFVWVLQQEESIMGKVTCLRIVIEYM